MVICHLGSGASLCAVKHGKSIDTTMGFTPLDGLMMDTPLLLSGLMVDSTIVLYDGSPTHLSTDGLWRVAAEAGVTVLGAGAGYLLACAKKELKPGANVKAEVRKAEDQARADAGSPRA